MEAGLGDAFILDALLVHRGGGRPQDIPAMDPVSQVPNVRWVAFMHVATCQLPKNVTDGIRPPFWASNPKFGQGDKVETCTTKGCRKRATEVCYSCKEVRLCPSHKMSLCSTCDIPSSSVSSAPNLWPTWWAMWGGDDAAYLLAMDATHGLNEQVADLEANEDVVWQGNVLGFSCIITGDGKNLLAGNPSRVSKCWICDDDQSLLLFTGCMDGVRWGVYLRCIPVSRRVGDYVHATSRVLCILVKRLRKELHSRGIHPGVRALDAIVNDVKEACKGIPESERIAPRRAKEHTFDLTMALAFMAKPVWHGEMINVVKHYMPDVVSPAGPYIWVVVHTLLRQFATIHQFWRQKSYFNEPEVLCYCKAVEQFATGWGDLGWKVSTWVHWTCAHSPFFAKKYRNFYIFSSIPSEKKNSPFKRDLHNSCKGWALLNPRLSIFSMGHVVNMSNLDLGLLARKIMQAKEKERRGILLGRKYLK